MLKVPFHIKNILNRQNDIKNLHQNKAFPQEKKMCVWEINKGKAQKYFHFKNGIYKVNKKSTSSKQFTL